MSNDEHTTVLQKFFNDLAKLAVDYIYWVGEPPKLLCINPEILARLSREPGFFQRPELQTEVTTHAPVVSRMQFDFGTVQIYERWEEKYLHFE